MASKLAVYAFELVTNQNAGCLTLWGIAGKRVHHVIVQNALKVLKMCRWQRLRRVMCNAAKVLVKLWVYVTVQVAQRAVVLLR